MTGTVRIGTRGSGLAMLQARIVAGKFNALGDKTEIIVIKTTGDMEKDVPLYSMKQTGVFVKELETALLEGRIDAAVHSLKDMPVDLRSGLEITAMLDRENPLDVFISAKYKELKEVPKGGSIAAGSIRRMSQVKAAMPGLIAQSIRGNVETRVKKIMESFDGGIMAAAGIIRLGLDKAGLNIIAADEFTPAPGQGIIAVETVNGSSAGIAAAKFDCLESRLCYTAERDFLKETGGGCSLPVGALCVKSAKGHSLYGYIGDEEGKLVYRGLFEFAEYNRPYGRELAEKLLSAGGRAVLENIRKKNSDNQHN
jgi:hydroxymethylbilane synthase